ncbi:MAG: ribosome biogenesis GTPase Der [Simkaniaceae bacterium]
MKMPKVALVGRPNVGKSSLFNRIVKKRMAIVDEMEGVTRDRLYAEVEIFGRHIKMIDTGGIDQTESIPFWREVKGQALAAIEEADVVVMVADGVVGLTNLDEEIARFLHSKNKPLILAVNKVDTHKRQDAVHNFHGIGIEKVMGVSAIQGFQIAELLELIINTAGEGSEEDEVDAINVAILGKPNVGKSTFLNQLLDRERSIVSPIAGTTRDSIDALFEHNGTTYRLIDTAGLRRKSKEPEVVDKFSRIRTERALKRADICLFMVDANEGVTAQEKKILKDIEESGKGCILYFNKWDTVTGFRMEHCVQRAKQVMPFLEHCPFLFGSAKTGRNVFDAMNEVKKVYSELSRRISTGQLNSFLTRVMQLNHPPMINGKRLRIYYMTQIASLPPLFVLFVNHLDRLSPTYQKYLINQFRKTYGFLGTPLKFIIRKRVSKERKTGQAPQLEGPSKIEELVFQ